MTGELMNKKQERMTKQRKVILEELCKVKSHPTAYDVYEMVRVKIPSISLGTVYRNLEHLSSKGLILKLDIGKGQKRFDATTKDHTHIMCMGCGKVDDIVLQPEPDLFTMKTIVNDKIGYELIGYGIELYGLCPVCREKDKQAGTYET
jgi:Fur family ferric uptake transcriptional regulator